jgi:hypothetical protein
MGDTPAIVTEGLSACAAAHTATLVVVAIAVGLGI